MADLTENLFEAINIVTEKKLKAVKFDETISATIVDASKAEKGEYIVSTGSAKFTAYGTETKYREKDTVMVTIPQGNYDNQKIIIGKQVDDNTNSALVFRSPFASFVDATKNLIPEAQSQEVFSILANDVNDTTNDYWAKGYWSTDILNFYNVDIQNKVLLWDSGQILYQDFTHMGIKADFQTFLNEYATIYGNYGLSVEITFSSREEAPTGTPSFFVNTAIFDSSDFFGNIYNFATYFSQEQVFDLSDFQDFIISNIKVYFYQRGNFLDKDAQLIPYETTVLGSTQKIEDNIFVRNLYVSLGVDAATFINDTASLVLNGSRLYYKGLAASEIIEKSLDQVSSLVFGTDEQATALTIDVTAEQQIIYNLSEDNYIIHAGYDNSKNMFQIITDGENSYQVGYVINLEYVTDDDDQPVQLRYISGLMDHVFAESEGQYYQIYYQIQDDIQVYAVQSEVAGYYNQIYYPFGSTESTFVTNFIEPLTEEYLKTHLNLKDIGIRWIHKDEKTDYIGLVEPQTFPASYEIRWYRYKLGAQAPDQFVGAHWMRFYGCKDNPDPENGESAYTAADFEYQEVEKTSDEWDFDGDTTYYIKQDDDYISYDLTNLASPYVYVKGTGFKTTSNIETYVKIYTAPIATEDLATNQLEISFLPNVNLASEKIKAIILKYEDSGAENFYRQIAATQELEFLNNSDVRSEATILDENALSIRFEDDEKGNYFLYNRAEQVGKDEELEIRGLTAVFDFDEHDVYKKAPLVDAYFVKWTFPAEPTMIKPAAAGYTTDPENRPLDPLAEHIFSNQSFAEAGYPEGYTEATWHQLEDPYSVGFFIKEKLNRNATNNTVRLEIIKDGQEFTAQAQMLFGTAGTSGSDYTVILDWDNGQNAFDAGVGYLTGSLLLMDQSGQIISLPDGAEWKCEWYKVFEASITDNRDYIRESRDLKYPVVPFVNQIEIPNNRADGGEVTYWAVSNNQYYKYDPSTKLFYGPYTYDSSTHKYYLEDDADGEELDYPILYSTVNESNRQYKIEFYPIDKIISGRFYDTSGAEALSDVPLFGYKNGNKIGYAVYTNGIYRKVLLDDDATTGIVYGTYDQDNTVGSGQITPFFIITDENGEKITYYNYSDTKKLFIQESGMFIIDPYDHYSEVETYYYPQYSQEREVSASRLRIGFGASQGPAANAGIDVMDKIVIEYFGTNDVSNLMNSLYTFKVTLTGFGDYDLEALYALPIKHNTAGSLSVDYIEGATDVRYATTGETDFDKNPYQITVREYDSETNSWIIYRHGYGDTEYEAVSISSSKYNNNASGEYYIENDEEYVLASGGFNSSIQYYIKTNKNPLSGSWILINSDDSVERSFIPKLLETGAVIDTTHFDIPKLDPPSVYFEDSPLCGVSFISSDDVALWTQPILMYRDNYPSTTLNKWTGKDIVTDEETGTILANGMAAGKKERDNTFTGVVLGDWSRTDTDPFVTAQTGVYGFNHGAMSYALKDDGTAFFGKDGKGRIYLNGNKAQIYSALWKTSEQGMLLDIDDGYIKIHGLKTQYVNIDGELEVYDSENPDHEGLAITERYATVSFSPAGTVNFPYFLIQNQQAKDLVRIQDNNYYLQTGDFSTQKQLGTKIDLLNGKITSYDFTLDTIKNKDYYVLIENSTTYAGIDEVYTYNSSTGEYDKSDPKPASWVANRYYEKTELSSGIKINSEGKPYLQIRDGSVNLLYIRKPISNNTTVGREYYLQSFDYKEHTILDGAINLANAKGIKIDLNDGKINGYNFAINGYKTEGTYAGCAIYINSGANYYPFQIIGSGDPITISETIQIQITYTYSGTQYTKDLYQVGSSGYAVRAYGRYWYIEGFPSIYSQISALTDETCSNPLSGALVWTSDETPTVSEVSDSDIAAVSLVTYSKTSTAFTVGQSNVSIRWDGTLYANNAQISGTITGSTINGSTITGSTISAGTITGATISAGTITGATISAGIITGAQLTGNLNAGSGGTITGGTISGGTIIGGTASIGNFYVDQNGNIRLNGWTFTDASSAGYVDGVWVCQGLITTSVQCGSHSGALGALAWEDDVKKKVTVDIYGTVSTTSSGTIYYSSSYPVRYWEVSYGGYYYYTSNGSISGANYTGGYVWVYNGGWTSGSFGGSSTYHFQAEKTLTFGPAGSDTGQNVTLRRWLSPATNDFDTIYYS